MEESPLTSITPIDEAGVRGFLHLPLQPAGDALALTHGAGANCQSPLLIALSEEFCRAGLIVLRYDLPFRQLRPHGPPIRTAEKDQHGVRLAIEFLQKRSPKRLFTGGHSYGGRQTTILLATQPDLAAGLLLLSYPLHPPKAPQQLRTAHFPDLRTSALFVHGSRDRFGTVDELSAALKQIPARTSLLMIEAAGHELLTKKNAKELPEKIRQTFTEMFGL